MRQRIKIEINTNEAFALEGYRPREITFDSPWRSGTAEVTTFSLEELLATKLRALYQRRKGRDLFDLWKARELKPDWERVVKMFLEYMSRSNALINRDFFRQNLEKKLIDERFNADLEGLLVASEKFQFKKAARFVETTILPLVPESKTKLKRRHSS